MEVFLRSLSRISAPTHRLYYPSLFLSFLSAYLSAYPGLSPVRSLFSPALLVRRGLLRGQGHHRRLLPPLTSQAISLIKDSSLVSTIAVYELTMEGRAIVADTFMTFEIWFTVAAIYLVVTVILSLVVNIMEVRFKVVH